FCDHTDGAPPVATPLSCFIILTCLTPSSARGIYTLSLHDALPISPCTRCMGGQLTVPAALSSCASCARCVPTSGSSPATWSARIDRKSTRLNSSHVSISYAVFCFKKKKSRHTRPSSKVQLLHTRPK